MEYSEALKARMIKRLTGPYAMSATALAKETGIAQATLSRWLLAAGTVGSVGKKQRKQITASKSPNRRTQDWSVEEKLRLLGEAAKLSGEELGAFLRREGLHSVQLEQWREAAGEALGQPKRKRGPSPEQRHIRELERQLKHKEKALAEAAALLVLKKKYEALFEDEEDDTEPRNGG